jgi:hypothetical protein
VSAGLSSTELQLFDSNEQPARSHLASLRASVNCEGDVYDNAPQQFGTYEYSPRSRASSLQDNAGYASRNYDNASEMEDSKDLIDKDPTSKVQYQTYKRRYFGKFPPCIFQTLTGSISRLGLAELILLNFVSRLMRPFDTRDTR